MKHFKALLIFSLFFSCSAPIESPTIQNNFTEPATPDQVLAFVKKGAKKSSILNFSYFGKSVDGLDLTVVKTSPKVDSGALRVLVFAQQHGNEHSGKEACLLLIRDLANGMHSSLTDNLEIWIVPQLNPDGSRLNKRRNANNVDLNRDHVLLQEPESKAINFLFKQFMPHVTIDIHEYFPYSNSWKKFGGYKNFDVQVGVSTNINVSEDILHLGLAALPSIEKHLADSGYSFHNYIVGPSPNLGRTRHSTVDIDDGRQSFSILNTLSFIFEGLNGKDSYIDNLERRSKSQLEALKALLRFLSENAHETVSLVESSRERLNTAKQGEMVAIRMEHFPSGEPLQLPLLSSKTGNDTAVIVENYHPIVKSTLDVSRPNAYLIPKKDSKLVGFLDLHGVKHYAFDSKDSGKIYKYLVTSIIVSEDEELENRSPSVLKSSVDRQELLNSYIKVPTNQLHSNFLVTLFEPQSMLGLAQKAEFKYLLKDNEVFPIYRYEE